MRSTKLLAMTLLLTAPALPTLADGGKWSPDQLSLFPAEELRALGLEIPAGELWDAAKGGGLLEAVVAIGGCTASFVSPDGLLVTNHHCVFDAVQHHSTPERNLIRDGFIAGSRAGELPAPTTRAQIPHRFVDVSAEIAAAIPADADALARFRAIDRKKKELVAACEAAGSRRCQVATFDDGVRYVLVEMLEFSDVRLVWAPPNAIGNYGGEVDNFSWPRHAGDVALIRVYADAANQPAAPAPGNRPYKPRHHFGLAVEGVAEGGFVMSAGFPGRTYRSTVAAEMAERAELFFPRRAELYGEWIALMEASAQDDEARIRLASRLRSLANRAKSSRGQVVGIEAGDLLAKKRAQEAEFKTWAAQRPDEAPAVAALDQLTAHQDHERATTWERDFLLTEAKAHAKSLALALTLTRWAMEREHGDLERDEDYQERNADKARDELRRDQKTLHLAAEKALMVDYLRRLLALPVTQAVPAVAHLRGRDLGDEVDVLLAGTKVHDLDQRLAMFGESAAQLRARRDPLLAFAFRLNEDLVAMKARRDAREGFHSLHRPIYRRALARFLGRPLDADANGTLRISFAKVAGYAPRDGLFATPRTYLRGLLAKDTGEEPFDAPDFLRVNAERAATSRYADPSQRDLPIDFLATADTTGGNSGSPMLDGRGRVAGLNFDRVWENVANDFGYNPAVARNISTDIRYFLWLLETLGGDRAQPLLKEMGTIP
jgi:hypothetical protein